MIAPPMKNIIARKNMAVMGDNFREWASDYFSKDSDHLDKKLVKKSVFDICRDETNLPKMTSNTFTKKLREFAKWADWIQELNPAEYRNSDGRIKSSGTEYIYLSSKNDPI